ncbi:MAG: SRPBCC family protein [Gaiellaceae bacterium]
MAEATEQLKETVSENGSGDGGSPLSGITNKSTLLPALATAAAAAAAGLAATKGPDLLKKLSGEANEEAEELGGKAAEGAKQQLSPGGGLMGKAASKLMGGGGGGGGQKGGKTRRLPIQRWTDVAVPVNKAYEAWTNFEEFPKFMHRVLEVKPNDDEDGDVIHWQEKIWFSTREWDGEIVERRRNDRIAWKTVSGTQHSGVISFHKLDDKLTRVMVDVDFLPTGMIEKMASGMRFVKRAVEADLARFKAYVEFGDVKELEYKATPAEMEQHRDDGGDERAEGDSQEAQSRSDSDGSSDEERERERQERESRREERKQSLASS